MTKIKEIIFSPYLLLGIIVLSLIAAVPPAAARHRAEQANRMAEIVLPYGELLEQQQQRGAGDFTLPEALQAFAEAGVGGLLFREQAVEDLQKLGELQHFEGADLLAAYRGGRGAGWINDLGDKGELLPGRFYLEISDAALWQRALHTFNYKSGDSRVHRLPDAGAAPGPGVLSLPGTSLRWLQEGTGFPAAAIEEAAAAGFSIYLQLAYWPGADAKSINALLRPLGELPSIAGLLFRDAMLPGFPKYTPELAAVLDELRIPLVTVEFFDRQVAELNRLSRSLEQKQVLRMHAITAIEMEELSAGRIVQRFRLAAAERNNRLLLLRFQGEVLLGRAWLEHNQQLCADVGAALQSADFTLGPPLPFGSLPFSRLNILLLGAGIIAAAVLLLRRFSCPAAAAGAAGAAAFLLLAALLAVAGRLESIDIIELARKGLALGAALVFPILGVLLIKPYLGSRSLARTIWAFALLTAVSLAGAFLLAALLSDLLYLVKLARFSGVTVALLLPPLVLLGYFAIYGNAGAQAERGTEAAGGFSPAPAGISPAPHGSFAPGVSPAARPSRLAAAWLPLRRFLEQPLLVGTTLAALAVLLLFYIYISRAGNESIFVGEIELRLRLLLGELFNVRPRTKEFLIGHPLMLLALYFGWRFRGGPVLLALGTIGQVSLINSFAHLHTPLLITLSRTGWGLALGIILGLSLLALYHLIHRRFANKCFE